MKPSDDTKHDSDGKEDDKKAGGGGGGGNTQDMSSAEKSISGNKSDSSQKNKSSGVINNTQGARTVMLHPSIPFGSFYNRWADMVEGEEKMVADKTCRRLFSLPESNPAVAQLKDADKGAGIVALATTSANAPAVGGSSTSNAILQDVEGVKGADGSAVASVQLSPSTERVASPHSVVVSASQEEVPVLHDVLPGASSGCAAGREGLGHVRIFTPDRSIKASATTTSPSVANV
jgi:hypothetical protein